ncbi:hypothetical protein OG455_03725 [Kitasatospora sp. NBC_01287]|uniref:hypothetical protein n=1 Tax=Kitasatospora sp. NBC_01287 TaxID=2903573 RepID=UPI0022549998|nr:hypothetical protein [Kitasatospora sp. NBC_01287]MCX4744639.1 hypothetical protein [Kitasatospora sp. NBC_01287]
MNSWINLNALWKIVVVGLLAGAGLPALFAIGLRLLSPPPAAGRGTVDRGGVDRGAAEWAIGERAAGERAAGERADGEWTAGEPAAGERTTAGPVGFALAGLCFAVVLAATGWGISVVVNHS